MFFCCKFLNGFYHLVLKLIWLWVMHLISCSPDVIAISIVDYPWVAIPLLASADCGWPWGGWKECRPDPASRKQGQWPYEPHRAGNLNVTASVKHFERMAGTQSVFWRYSSYLHWILVSFGNGRTWNKNDLWFLSLKIHEVAIMFHFFKTLN